MVAEAAVLGFKAHQRPRLLFVKGDETPRPYPSCRGLRFSGCQVTASEHSECVACSLGTGRQRRLVFVHKGTTVFYIPVLHLKVLPANREESCGAGNCSKMTGGPKHPKLPELSPGGPQCPLVFNGCPPCLLFTRP